MSVKSITLPTGWDGVSLNQWQKIIELSQEELEPVDFNIELLSILSGVPSEEIYTYPLTDVQRMINSIAFINTNPNEDKVKIKKEYTIAGKKYKLFKKISEITTAQYLDFQSYSRDMNKNIGELLAVFLIPSGLKYNEGYDLEETIEDIKGNDGISVRDAMSLMSFFGKEFLVSTLSSLKYSLTKTQKVMKELKEKDPEKAKELELKLQKLCSTGLLSWTQFQRLLDYRG